MDEEQNLPSKSTEISSDSITASEKAKSKTTTFVIIIVAVFVLLTITSASIILLLSKKQSVDENLASISPTSIIKPTATVSPSATTSAELSFPTEWTTFTSELGFSFEYPAEWGEVLEEILDAEKTGTGDTGKTYFLKFSKLSNTSNYSASASGRSADYSAGRGIIPGDYTGHVDKPLEIYSSLEISPLTIDNKIPRKYGVFPSSGLIEFNLPGREISGVRMFIELFDNQEGKEFAALFYKQHGQPSEQCLNYGDCKSEDSQARELYTQVLEQETFNKNIAIKNKIYKKILESSRID